jgi:hypothetical protein
MVERPAPASGVVTEELDGEVCLYRPTDDEVLILNTSAADIWRLADGASTATEIVELLARAYQVSVEQIRADVLSTLADLTERGFLSALDADESADPTW